MTRLGQALLRFTVIGGLGFLADAGILTMLASGAGVDVYLSRLCSFAVASVLTWWLNRIWTFSSAGAKRTREYFRYIAVQIVGALINLAIFALLIRNSPWMADVPALPLAVGSVVAMIFNFVGCRYLVFTTPGSSRPAAND